MTTDPNLLSDCQTSISSQPKFDGRPGCELDLTRLGVSDIYAGSIRSIPNVSTGKYGKMTFRKASHLGVPLIFRHPIYEMENAKVMFQTTNQ